MKLAIFSDVHGNIYAFEKILKSMKEHKVDKFIFCGDICGYYYYQNEIIDIFRSMENLICVLGNHDKLFLDILEDETLLDDYTRKYGKSMEILKENITPDNLKYLQSLNDKEEIQINTYKIGIFHGNPFNHLEGYVYPDTEINEYRDLKYQYLFLGHTHYQMIRKIGNTTIINPGSCGQPRDGNLPSYILLDLISNTLETITVEYNRELLIKDIKRNNDKNKYLIDILYRRK